jgi:hypothetical protein
MPAAVGEPSRLTTPLIVALDDPTPGSGEGDSGEVDEDDEELDREQPARAIAAKSMTIGSLGWIIGRC